MKTVNLYYPIALIAIIVFAGAVMYTGFIKPQQVDLAKYQALCVQYLKAPAGRYTHDQMQLLVEKVNYLFPASAQQLSLPAEREVKTCAKQLSEKLKTTRR
jgi:hypothetical protein